MGYDVDILIDEIAPELLCPVCNGILEAPIRTPCSHLFCKECLNTWLNKNRTCPQCRENLSSFNGNKEDRLIKNIVGATKVKCTQFMQGCPWEGKLELIASHSCFTCSSERCPYKIQVELQKAEIASLKAEVQALQARIAELDTSSSCPAQNTALALVTSPAKSPSFIPQQYNQPNEVIKEAPKQSFWELISSHSAAHPPPSVEAPSTSPTSIEALTSTPSTTVPRLTTAASIVASLLNPPPPAEVSRVDKIVKAKGKTPVQFLFEWCQEKKHQQPIKTCKQIGNSFVCTICISDVLQYTGPKEHSKKAAEHLAATHIIALLEIV